jgi:hypothetical protein
MATAVFAETLGNSQYSTRLIPERRSCTLNSSREYLRKKNILACYNDNSFYESHKLEYENRLSGKQTQTKTILGTVENPIEILPYQSGIHIIFLSLSYIQIHNNISISSKTFSLVLKYFIMSSTVNFATSLYFCLPAAGFYCCRRYSMFTASLPASKSVIIFSFVSKAGSAHDLKVF